MYTLSLQREDPTSTGSNAGVMTIGGLPSGISNSSLTWVPVQPYDTSVALFGNLQSLQDLDPTGSLVAAAQKIMPTTPMLWEAAIDGVYIDGKRLSDETEGLTALFDSGTTQTLLTATDLQSSLLPSISSEGTVPCNTVLNLSIGIGGKQFPINPFDLIEPADNDDSEQCFPGISEADAPSSSEFHSPFFCELLA